MRVCCVVWGLLECGEVMLMVYLLFDIIVVSWKRIWNFILFYLMSQSVASRASNASSKML